MLWPLLQVVTSNGNRRGGDGEGSKWMSQAKSIRESLWAFDNTKKASRPWSSHARMQGISCTPRHREILDVAFLDAERNLVEHGLRTTREDIANNLFCDVSQNLSRKPWGGLRTLTTSTILYSFQKDRLILPEEGLRILGFPSTSTLVRGISQGDVSDIVGQAMAVPAVVLPTMALLLAAIKCNTASLSDLCDGSGSDESHGFGLSEPSAGSLQ